MDWQHFTIGARLRIACEMKGLDFQDAASACGLDRTTFYTLTSDKSSVHGPTISTLTKVATGLGLRLCWLIVGEGEVWQLPETQKADTPKGVPARAPALPIRLASLTPVGGQKKPKRR